MSAGNPRQLVLGFKLDDTATLDNFLASGQDQSLLRHLQENVLHGTEPLTVIGGKSGSGKTHLLQALCHALACEQGSPIYVPLARSGELIPEMLEGLEELDLVCLDDVDTIAGQPGWEQALFTLYNRARDSRVRLVAALAQPVSSLAFSLPDLRSRLQSGVFFQLHDLADIDKERLLQQRASSLGMNLSDAVVSYILQRHERSVSGLNELLLELDRQSLEQKRPVTVPLVREIIDRLKDTLP